MKVLCRRDDIHYNRGDLKDNAHKNVEHKRCSPSRRGALEDKGKGVSERGYGEAVGQNHTQGLRKGEIVLKLPKRSDDSFD